MIFPITEITFFPTILTIKSLNLKVKYVSKLIKPKIRITIIIWTVSTLATKFIAVTMVPGPAKIGIAKGETAIFSST